MTHDEFDKFFARHTARFPQFESWLAERLDDAGVTEYLESFRVTLRHVGYQEAVAASLEMFDGPGVPFGEHPATLRQTAQRIAAERRPRDRWADGQPTYRCLRCEDSGTVEVWTGDAVETARRTGSLAGVRYKTACVRCTCGVQGLGWMRVTFDEARHLAAPARAYQDSDEALAELVAFANRRPPNYEPAFEETRYP